jgi:hypothetical protein
VVLAMLLAMGGAAVFAAATPGWPDGQPVTFSTVARGSQSGIRESLQVLIRSDPEWADLWRRHTAPVLPPPPVPQIDFGHQMVIGVFIGKRPSGGHEVEVVDVREAAGRLAVRYRGKIPPAGMLTTQALTYPYHLIRLRRSDLPVAFEAQ